MFLNRFLGLPVCAGVILTIASPAQAAHYVPPASGYTLNAKIMGAKGDGVTDDRPALQAALSLLQSQGGGTLTVPAGTYLLNSYGPSAHPWFFYNLLVGSNVFIQGSPGARFLQGPGGQAPVQKGATYVRNSVLAFGTLNYVTNTFQIPSYNGGFYSLQPTSAGNTTVALTTAGQAQSFVVGDYVAIYSTTLGDVIPSETSQVTAVNSATGAISLKWPLARAFQSPSIARVTPLATYNVGVSNVIVQGSEPLAAEEVFNFTAENCQFISDLSVPNNTYGPSMNTIRDFRLIADQFSSVGPGYVEIQLPQRNSQTGTIEGSTFTAQYVVFGEYAANWNLSGNTFALHPQPSDSAGLSLGGLNVTFANNTVSGAGVVPLIADYSGLPSYIPYVGQINITGNTVTCVMTNSNCLLLASPSPTVMNNLIIASGNVVGIKVEGPMPQVASISQNSISITGGTGIVMNTPQIDQSIVIGNTITGSGPEGVYVASPGSPNSGADVITGNCISGFATSIAVNMTSHPGILVSSASTCGSPAQTMNIVGGIGTISTGGGAH